MLTSRTEEFTNCFINNKPFNEQIKSWKRVLKKFLNICFKKVRINKKFKSLKITKQKTLFDKRRRAIHLKDKKVKKKLKIKFSH